MTHLSSVLSLATLALGLPWSVVVLAIASVVLPLAVALIFFWSGGSSSERRRPREEAQ